jgi:NADH-quinone oxidoreductase subunit L
VRYARKGHVPVAEGQMANPIQKALYHKYYVDEIYDQVIVKPLYVISRVFENVIERLGIDNIVNGSGKIVVEGSKLSRLIQTGRIGYYIFVMVIGIIVIMTVAAFQA